MESFIYIVAALLSIAAIVTGFVKWGYPKVKGYFDRRRQEREDLLKRLDLLNENFLSLTHTIRYLQTASRESGERLDELAQRVGTIEVKDWNSMLVRLHLVDEEQAALAQKIQEVSDSAAQIRVDVGALQGQHNELRQYANEGHNELTGKTDELVTRVDGLQASLVRYIAEFTHTHAS